MRVVALKAEIVEIGRRLYARGLIGGNEGNVSARDGDVLYVTPAGVCKGFLTPEQIVATDLQGRPTGGGRASTEIHMHTAVYRRRPDVKAVVTLGPVPIIPCGMPSTADLAENVGLAICDAQAVLLARTAAGYPPPVCVDCPTCGTSVPVAVGDQVVLTRAELARVVAEAVERFSGTRS